MTTPVPENTTVDPTVVWPPVLPDPAPVPEPAAPVVEATPIPVVDLSTRTPSQNVVDAVPPVVEPAPVDPTPAPIDPTPVVEPAAPAAADPTPAPELLVPELATGSIVFYDASVFGEPAPAIFTGVVVHVEAGRARVHTLGLARDTADFPTSELRLQA